MKLVRLIACLCVLGAASAHAQEAPPKLALAWNLAVEPDEGYTFEYQGGLALHADGTALLALVEEKGPDQKLRRIMLQSVSPAGQPIARTSPIAETADSIGPIGLAAEPDGFALATITFASDPDAKARPLALRRLARDGSVRTAQDLQLGPRPIHEISGVAADGRGNVIIYGGIYEGPHAPAMVFVDTRNRVAWFFAGKHTMPPGGVPRVRFRRDGGSDAVVVDREKPYWERRSAQGKLLARAALPRHHDCWGFLDERRLVTAFYNWEAQPALRVPAKQWALALVGPNGRYLPGERAFDAGARENAYCKLAVNDAGWIALSLEPKAIALLDGALQPRAAIDLAALRATSVEAIAVDAQGAVTALIDTRLADQAGRKLRLVRFAAPLR